MVATLNQPQYQPWPMEDQVVALWAGNEGFLDPIPVAEVPRFQDELREHLRAEGSVYKTIRETGDLAEDTEQKLRAEVEKFARSFSVEERSAA
jgi:F-type H+-transporting ATPase subunit alpha